MPLTLHTAFHDQPRQRAIGAGSIAVKAAASGVTQLADLYQKANAKIRIPRVYGNHLEAVLINTSGGMTGGDRMDWTVDAGAGTALTVTTQACEKIYRSDGDTARVETKITVGANARVDWLPQETILFDRGELDRSLVVDLDEAAEILAIEAIVLGREAMGETLRHAALKDRWEIRRGRKLLHADVLRMDGDLATQGRSAAVLNGANAFATIVWSPAGTSHEALQARCHALRALAENGPAMAGFSVLPGRLAGRFCAHGMFALRQTVVPVLQALTANGTVPKVWSL